MKKLSQTALYGELLSSEEQYRQDIAQLPRFTQEQRERLIERAQGGDAQARHDLVLSCIGYVTSVSRKYATICAASSARVEFLDLVQIGNLTLLERLNKALAHPNPIGYLYKAACGAIIEYCQTRTSLVKTPKDSTGKPLPPLELESLDRPAFRDESGGYSNEEVMCVELHLPEQEPDYTLLYEAVEELAPTQKEVIQRHYGLGCEAESVFRIGLEMRARQGKPLTRKCANKGYRYHQRGLEALQKKLAKEAISTGTVAAVAVGASARRSVALPSIVA